MPLAFKFEPLCRTEGFAVYSIRQCIHNLRCTEDVNIWRINDPYCASRSASQCSISTKQPSVCSYYRVRHKSINTPLSHKRLVGGLQDGGRGTHVTHFVQLYPQPLYTASQVHTTCRSWDEGVLTDVCLTGVLTDLRLTRCFSHKKMNI